MLSSPDKPDDGAQVGPHEHDLRYFGSKLPQQGHFWFIFFFCKVIFVFFCTSVKTLF
jgi:hypothetical protein